MANQKIKSLFYESPKPPKKVAVAPQVVTSKDLVKNRVMSIIGEGVMFGAGPKLYGTGQSQLSQAKGGGGGYAGPIAVAKKPGETQFGIIEEEDDAMSLDAVAQEMESSPDAATPDQSTEETPADASTDAPAEETPAEEPADDAPAEPADAAPSEPPAPPEPEETPEQKVTKMFSDTGDVDEDYSLSNENNIRLEKFKFTNAGIDLKKLIPEDDQKSGISTKDVANLLTPSQRDMLKDKNRELRKQYPLMDKREKNLIIHNSNVPIFNTVQGHDIEISSDMKKQAYDKINAYLETNFAKNWQDKSKAINFLRTIKINFSDAPAIRANLIDMGSMMSEEGENYKIPLDKINVLVPVTIQDFIKKNKEDPTFAKSNIFRTLTSAYNQESGTKGQIYIIFNSENLGEGEEAPTEGEAPPEEAPTEGEAPAEGGEDEMAGALENAVEPLPAG